MDSLWGYDETSAGKIQVTSSKQFVKQDLTKGGKILEPVLR
jgi:hypothetical protein